ncbi:OmpA family protein [Candidatus Kaiserbacteria bacterium]|nr:OmpA family protein [Candidatus Kaiserbacteria bacterium]MCB9812460.1 OmpA family protein [Candidatus Nomurabacteria bacterium]
MFIRIQFLLVVALLLAGCASNPRGSATDPKTSAVAQCVADQTAQSTAGGITRSTREVTLMCELERLIAQHRVQVPDVSLHTDTGEAASVVTLQAAAGFAPGGTLLKDPVVPLLEQLGWLLYAVPDLKAHVVGHTDSIGERAVNQRLSELRAEVVARQLLAYSGNVTAAGKGELEPVADNRYAPGRAQNRRVEIIFSF